MHNTSFCQPITYLNIISGNWQLPQVPSQIVLADTDTINFEDNRGFTLTISYFGRSDTESLFKYVTCKIIMRRPPCEARDEDTTFNIIVNDNQPNSNLYIFNERVKNNMVGTGVTWLIITRSSIPCSNILIINVKDLTGKSIRQKKFEMSVMNELLVVNTSEGEEGV